MVEQRLGHLGLPVERARLGDELVTLEYPVPTRVLRPKETRDGVDRVHPRGHDRRIGHAGDDRGIARGHGTAEARTAGGREWRREHERHHRGCRLARRKRQGTRRLEQSYVKRGGQADTADVRNEWIEGAWEPGRVEVPRGAPVQLSDTQRVFQPSAVRGLRKNGERGPEDADSDQSGTGKERSAEHGGIVSRIDELLKAVTPGVCEPHWNVDAAEIPTPESDIGIGIPCGVHPFDRVTTPGEGDPIGGVVLPVEPRRDHHQRIPEPRRDAGVIHGVERGNVVIGHGRIEDIVVAQGIVPLQHSELRQHAERMRPPGRVPRIPFPREPPDVPLTY